MRLSYVTRAKKQRKFAKIVLVIIREDIPKEVVAVADSLEGAGFEAYLVGGCVRDLLLGRTPKDWDLTTNAKPEEIQALFPETYCNNDYGTVGVVNEETTDLRLKVVEVTPYRSEGEYSDRRRPDKVEFGVSLEEDLKRRDFTVNAIAYRKSSVMDIYDGIKDIKDKTIKTVGNPTDRFQEDALRLLRAVRFAAELDFSIDKGTAKAIYDNSELIKDVSCERIRDELTKIIDSPNPMSGLILVSQCGLLVHILPELENAIGIEQGGEHVYDVWEHTLRAVQHAADKNWSFHVKLAALFHDIGKPPTRRADGKGGKKWTFYGHEVVSERIAGKVMDRLKFPVKLTDTVSLLVRNHMFFSDPDKITLSAVRRVIAKVGPDLIWDLMNLRICDRVGMGRPKEEPYRLRKYQSMIEEALRAPTSVGMLKIDGRRIMDVTHETPGPKVGMILNALMEEVLEEPEKNTEGYLNNRAIELSKMPEKGLRMLAEKGKERKEAIEEQELKKIRGKYGVK